MLDPDGGPASCFGVVTLLAFLDLEDLRLDILDRLAHLGVESHLAYGELPEGQEVFLGHADDRRENPGLVLRILTVDVASLPLEGVHAGGW